MNVILMGAQGAGKGTQAERIAPAYRLWHLSTGDLFRSAIANGTELGTLAKGYIDRGELVPDEVTIGIVDAKLGEIEAASEIEGVLFDGFPRTRPQAVGLDEALAKRGQKIDVVIEIAVPREKLVERLAGRRVCSKCGATYHIVFNPPKDEHVCDRCGGSLIQRDDDKPEAINRRLDIYFAQTEPLLEYYNERGLLRRIDGDRPIDEVTADINAAIDTVTVAR